MKLINLLFRERNNYRLGGDFQVSRHEEICQFDRFSLEINFKRACSCYYGIYQTRFKLKTIYHTGCPKIKMSIKNPNSNLVITLLHSSETSLD